MKRGELRVYLGAAPGVGKTFAMLDEGWRRRERGTDVVIGVVETHGRARTVAQLRDLEIVPRRTVVHRGTELQEMDLDAILQRRPQLVLVDELAHTNAPGSRHEKRWQDVAELLDAGIHVVTTVNIQHLESLNDVVERITGIKQRETVPDAVVRGADQIELVDMSPEALRRRLAHGNVYPAERVDAALRNYFRDGNLAALRELALLWVADRVEDGLDDYRRRHGITEAWETRERVVVAVSGAPDGDRLIRRAARIAQRARGELIGVHVISADGLRRAAEIDAVQVERNRKLVGELGGRYHEIGGEDVAATLAEFARTQGATQLVLGASRTTGWRSARAGSVIGRVLNSSRGIDVHVIGTPEDSVPPPRRRRMRLGSLPLRRVLLGWAIVLVGLPLTTFALTAPVQQPSLATDLLVFLVVVVAAAAVGGIVPGLVGAVVASLLVNWYFVEPLHTLSISEPENATSLVIFVAVAGVVSGYVNLSARRAAEARRAQADAEALSRTTATLIGSADPVPDLVEALRATFRLDGVTILRRNASDWDVVSSSGVAATDPSAGRSHPIDPDATTVLVVTGRVLDAREEASLLGHAGQLFLGLSAQAHRHEALRAETLEEIDRLRTAMLHSVSHDLRTPLATIKAGVASLRSPDITLTPAASEELLEAVDHETDRLVRLVENLLDMSRIEAGAVEPRLHAVAASDAISWTVAAVDDTAGRVVVHVPDDLPPVAADDVLLTRALTNVLANAMTWSPPGSSVRIDAGTVDPWVSISVVDVGPGIPDADRGPALRPFQRFDDAGSRHGTGLGLAVADGFVRSMGGTLVLDDTPGGGLTVTVRLPVWVETSPEAPAATPVSSR